MDRQREREIKERQREKETKRKSHLTPMTIKQRFGFAFLKVLQNGERQIERDTERETERQRDREKEIDRQRGPDRETEREKYIKQKQKHT